MVKIQKRSDYNGEIYISDIVYINITCLNCNKNFIMDMNANFNTNIITGCMNCKTRHMTFMNDGCIFIDAYRGKNNDFYKEKNHIKKRHMITILEW